jgi:hypothetical protein
MLQRSSGWRRIAYLLVPRVAAPLRRTPFAVCLTASTFGADADGRLSEWATAGSAMLPIEVQLGQVAIYCRVTTDDQCCDRQARDLRAFAKRAGHKIVGVFKETASGAKAERAERKKVMALDQARKIDAILVTELCTSWCIVLGQTPDREHT